MGTTKDYINTNFYSCVCLSTNKIYKRLYLYSIVSFFFQIHGILYHKIQISKAQRERGNNHVATIYVSS